MAPVYEYGIDSVADIFGQVTTGPGRDVTDPVTDCPVFDTMPAGPCVGSTFDPCDEGGTVTIHLD